MKSLQNLDKKKYCLDKNKGIYFKINIKEKTFII